jgi:hypothetical protein
MPLQLNRLGKIMREIVVGVVCCLVSGHLGEGLVELLADGLELLLLVAQLICGGERGGLIDERFEFYEVVILTYRDRIGRHG